ncbi:hypothetical protein HGRIS_007289 [Hohenbuehelia grisea]|uniref:Amine oxidase domain-containing protein n=1 Tax=Hohenbuehelia grisea TaxID=104357 RepID=A0ABR3J4P5_9AGAR
MARRTAKVAVIGSGLAGLTAAYELARHYEAEDGIEFEVHLFEKTESIGMDSASVSLRTQSKERDWRIDVPMRSFQGGYYPRLIDLYKRIGVSFLEADFTYSFSRLAYKNTGGRQITASSIYNGASGRRGIGMPSTLRKIYAQRKDHSSSLLLAARVTSLWLFAVMTLRLVVCYLRLLLHSVPVFRDPRLPGMTFSQWAEETTPHTLLARCLGLDTMWKQFVTDILMPLFSAICTASKDDIIDHPAEEMLDYIWLTFGTHHYLVRNGVTDVVARLTAPLRHIHLSTPIASINYDPQNPTLASITCISAGGPKVFRGFDHIVFATQAPRAIPLLETYTSSLPEASPVETPAAQLIQCLKKFRYIPSIVINHTDDTLLPDDVRDRRELNLIDTDGHLSNARPQINCVPSSYTMATQIVRQPSWYALGPVVFQTTNPVVPPREETIISVSRLERAVLTMASKTALVDLYTEERQWWQCPGQGIGKLGRLQGATTVDHGEGVGMWFCGSYVYGAIPLLEGCVVSAQLVVEGIRKRERDSAGVSRKLE